MPDTIPAATLPNIIFGLGQVPSYARLHIPWLGCLQQITEYRKTSEQCKLLLTCNLANQNWQLEGLEKQNNISTKSMQKLDLDTI